MRATDLTVKSTDSGGTLPGFHILSIPLQAGYPWENCLTSPRLQFPVCKLDLIMILPSQGCCEGSWTQRLYSVFWSMPVQEAPPKCLLLFWLLFENVEVLSLLALICRVLSTCMVWEEHRGPQDIALGRRALHLGHSFVPQPWPDDFFCLWFLHQGRQVGFYDHFCIWNSTPKHPPSLHPAKATSGGKVQANQCWDRSEQTYL